MFTWYGKSRRQQHYRCPEACGGPYRMGVTGAHNTVEGKYRRLQYYLCQDGCRVLFLQAYRVWSLVSWFDLCALACFLRLSPGPFRAGVPGRMAPVGSCSCQSENSGEQGCY